VRKFPPLGRDHPALGTPCALCLTPVKVDDITAIVAVNPCSVEDQAKADRGLAHLAESAILHWACVPDDVRAEIDGG